MDQPMLDTKALFAPKKGKQATKGQKQIDDENKATLRWYVIMAAISLGFKFLSLFISTTFYDANISTVTALMTLFAIALQGLGISSMYYTSKTNDLNLKGGFGDKLKDLVITTTFCTCLSIFHNAFWLLWLWLPSFLCYQVWVNFIAPWIFAPAPEDLAPEVSEKKRRKMERKMARSGYGR